MKLIFILMLLSINLFAKPFIHTEMEKAIKQNERIIQNKKAFKNWVIIDGKRYWTGFNPTSEFYQNATFLNFKADPEIELPKSFDIRKNSHSPVRGQIQGSCWAEGSASAFELTWNFIKQAKLVFGVNDVIDCSGFGTAANGGQLSLEYATKKGLAYESDYKYTGRDGRCKKDVERHLPLKSAPYLRGENGGFPTEQELMAAAYKYGAMEVCGSASALGSGGRQDIPKGGATNHCYAYAGWLDGKEMGWLDAKYHIIKNSWGDGSNSPLNLSGGDWGDKGYGYYRLSRDGEKILGAVITEIQVANTGEPFVPVPPTPPTPPVPPVPPTPPVPDTVEFMVRAKHAVVDVKVEGTSKTDPEKLKKNLKTLLGGKQ